jgi:hypothetical protein
MIFERNELILEQEKILEQKNHGLSLQSPKQKWHQYFSTILEQLTGQGQYDGS